MVTPGVLIRAVLIADMDKGCPRHLAAIYGRLGVDAGAPLERDARLAQPSLARKVRDAVLLDQTGDQLLDRRGVAQEAILAGSEQLIRQGYLRRPGYLL